MSGADNKKRSRDRQTTLFSSLKPAVSPSVDSTKKARVGSENQINQSAMETKGPPANGTHPVLNRSGSSVGGAKKKLVIQPFKVAPKPPALFEDETLKKLENAVEGVFAMRSFDMSQEELYRSVESLCLHKKGGVLYDKLYNQCRSQVHKTMVVLAGQVGNDPSTFLAAVEEAWQRHCEHMQLIRSLFLYLDRTFVLQQTKARSLWDMGLGLFAEHLREYSSVEKALVSGVLATIERERNGDSVSKQLLKKLVKMWMALKMYQKSFERPFLEASSAYYEKEGKRLIKELPCAEYLIHVHKRIQQESARLDEYLDESSKVPLLKLVELQLIKIHVPAIINQGFDELMSHQRMESLSLMYRLLNKVEALDRMKVALGEYTKRAGLSLVMPEEKDVDMVNNLLNFKDSLDRICAQAFDSNRDFSYAVKQAWESFVNERENKPAELMARYIDEKLRTGSKGLSGEEVETMLDKVMVIFRFLYAKDVFQAFYKKDLARRLLLNKSASIDTERSMIAKLKAECGPSFTSKFESMFRDMDLSKHLNSEFESHLLSLGNAPPMEFFVHVLTSSSWPAPSSMSLALPSQVTTIQDEFKNFYVSQHSGRKLVWDHSKASCVLKANLKTVRDCWMVEVMMMMMMMMIG